MLHQQLAVAVEQIGQRALALGRVEHIGFVDAHPGQGAALAGEFVGLVAQGFFLCQQRLALGDPLVAGHHGVVGEGGFGEGGCHGRLLGSLSRWGLGVGINVCTNAIN